MLILFSIPYLYLLYSGVDCTTSNTISNPKTITSISDFKLIYHIHAGYAATLLSFYLLPVILFTKKNFLKRMKEYFFLKKTYFYLVLFILFNLYNLIYFDFEKFTVTDYWVGLGIVHKLSLIVTGNLYLQEIITYIFFFFHLLFYCFIIMRINMMVY